MLDIGEENIIFYRNIMRRKTGWWMNIADKTEISKEKCCPPHYVPHKLPFGEKICDEPCHFHNAKWRMMHHIYFCKKLKCPHFEFMMKKKTNFKK